MTRRTVRPGVTLIELLIVIGLLALLTAIAAGTYFVAVGGQQSSNTEATLAKLDAKLMARWTAVIDEARTQPIPQEITNYAAGNKERARAIWTYMRLKNEFPTTRTEAQTGVVVNGFTLPARTVFGSSNLAVGKTTQEESGTCFLNSIMNTGTGGNATQLDGFQQQMIDVQAGRAFKDGWGMPIAFVRMGFAAEANTGRGANTDPIDPRGLLNTTEGTWDMTRRDQFWTIITANHLTGCGVPTTYVAQKWTPTLVSAGTNKEWGASLYGGDDDSDDNVVSFRIRAGMKGN